MFHAAWKLEDCSDLVDVIIVVFTQGSVDIRGGPIQGHR